MCAKNFLCYILIYMLYIIYMGALAWVAEVYIELPERAKGTKNDCPFLPLLWASQLWSPICTPNSVLIRKTAPETSSRLWALPWVSASMLYLRLFSWRYLWPKTHGFTCLCFLGVRIIGLSHHARLQTSGFLLHNSLWKMKSIFHSTVLTRQVPWKAGISST